MATLEIRNATVDDAPALVDLYRQLDPAQEPARVEQARETVRTMVGLPWLHLLVATLDGEVVGTVTLAVVPNMTHGGRPWAQLENLVVREDRRREGIGHALVARCEAILREAGGYKLQLMSRNARKDAHKFYAAEGYETLAVAFRKYF